MKDTFDTYVAGVTYKNPNGVSIQSILKKYVKENYDTDRFDIDDYDYWTNDEIEEYDFKVYQYELYETGTISLVPDPNNPYDPNAIMVLHKDMGMIGYIPKNDNINLATFLNNDFDNVRVDMELESGPYKYYDLETDKVKKKNNPYYLRLFVKPLIYSSEIADNTSHTKSPTTKVEEKSIDNNSDYDIFEWLSKSNYPNLDIKTSVQKPVLNTEESSEHIKNITYEYDNKYKNPLLYLAAAIISTIAAIILIITDHYILMLIPIILAISFTMLYFEIKDRKETQSW